MTQTEYINWINTLSNEDLLNELITNTYNYYDCVQDKDAEFRFDLSQTLMKERLNPNVKIYWERLELRPNTLEIKVEVNGDTYAEKLYLGDFEVYEDW